VLQMLARGGSVTQSTYKIQISDTEFVPNTFLWSKDNGNWSEHIRIDAGSWQQLDGELLEVKFSHDEGWTKHVRWLVETTYTKANITSTPSYRYGAVALLSSACLHSRRCQPHVVWATVCATQGASYLRRQSHL